MKISAFKRQVSTTNKATGIRVTRDLSNDDTTIQIHQIKGSLRGHHPWMCSIFEADVLLWHSPQSKRPPAPGS